MWEYKQTKPRRRGRTRPARACEMCKENQRVLPFRSREAYVSFFAFPCNRNLRLHNIHDKKKSKEKEHCCPATGEISKTQGQKQKSQ
jgi:hypothetical protein